MIGTNPIPCALSGTQRNTPEETKWGTHTKKETSDKPGKCWSGAVAAMNPSSVRIEYKCACAHEGKMSGCLCECQCVGVY